MMKINKMASIAIIIGGALINATAFVVGSYLAEYFFGDQNSAEEEKKRHDIAVEKYPAAYEKYQENPTSSSIGLQLMTESRSRKNIILWTQIML